MNITNLSTENTIRLFIDNLDDFKEILYANRLTNTVNVFFENCFEQTLYCQRANASYKIGHNYLVFDRKYSKISPKSA